MVELKNDTSRVPASIWDIPLAATMPIQTPACIFIKPQRSFLSLPKEKNNERNMRWPRAIFPRAKAWR